MNTHDSFTLVVKSYKAILPFVLFYVVGEFLLNSILDFQHNFNGFNTYLLKFVGLHSIFYLLCLLSMVTVCYQVQHNMTLNYLEIIKQSLNKLISASFSFLLIAPLFAFIFAVFGFLLPCYFSCSGIDCVILSLCVALIFFAIGLLFFVPQFFISLFLIAIRDEGPMSSIRKSSNLYGNGWFIFFIKILGLIILKMIVTGLFYLILPFTASEVSNLLILPLTACVIVVQAQNLEMNVKGQSSVIASVPCNDAPLDLAH